MPYKQTFLGAVMALFTAPGEAVKVFGILISGAIARWCLGDDNSFKKRFGDLIVCGLMYYITAPFLGVFWLILPTKYQQAIPQEALTSLLAIAIALLGSHGIYAIIRFFVKRKAGIDLQEIK